MQREPLLSGINAIQFNRTLKKSVNNKTEDVEIATTILEEKFTKLEWKLQSTIKIALHKQT